MEALQAAIAQGLEAALAEVVSTMRANTEIKALVGRDVMFACAQVALPEVGRLWRRQQPTIG